MHIILNIFDSYFVREIIYWILYNIFIYLLTFEILTCLSYLSILLSYYQTLLSCYKYSLYFIIFGGKFLKDKFMKIINFYQCILLNLLHVRAGACFCVSNHILMLSLTLCIHLHVLLIYQLGRICYLSDWEFSNNISVLNSCLN